MSITINGETKNIPSPCNVSELLEKLYQAGKPVVVERNGQAVFPGEFERTQLEEGDRIEIVSIVAGG